MITLDQILSAYPENLRAFKESVLKEYLQYKILNSIYNSDYANKLAFLGGTALRIVYGSTRFSEDLDFEELARDTEPFLFDPRDKRKVLLFREFLEQNF